MLFWEFESCSVEPWRTALGSQGEVRHGRRATGREERRVLAFRAGGRGVGGWGWAGAGQACSALLEAVGRCRDALRGRGAFAFAVARRARADGSVPDDDGDEEAGEGGGDGGGGGGGGGGGSTALSYSRMLLPDTWQLVRKAPLFRGRCAVLYLRGRPSPVGPEG